MPTSIETKVGTAIVFKASGGDVTFTPESTAAAGGNSMSGTYDLATNLGASRPTLFGWVAATKWGTAPDVGETLDIYLATSDGTYPDHDDGTTDGALGALDKLRNLTYIGSIEANEASATVQMVKRGICEIWADDVQVVWVNRSAADALSATTTDHYFALVPLNPEIQ